ncbi:MAG TPA: class I SAM-dependent methyltransferase [Rhodanobacteraceae bacterium]|nr:class I SAM-dependent methyltransferase [Rhodanobacteraceae bacterium]
MSRRNAFIPEAIEDYLQQHALREPELLAELRRQTAEMPQANMQICAEQGQLMALLVALMGARRCIEVGVFTGYSSLAVALVLPADGHLLACDVSEEWTNIARGYWQRAGVGDKIDLKLGPAADTLQQAIDAGQSGRYDFAFIDADKGGYASYYELVLTLLRPGGLVAVDNTLWSGRVADAGKNDDSTLAIRAFNDRLHADQRVDLSLLPIGDGLTLARKR